EKGRKRDPFNPLIVEKPGDTAPAPIRLPPGKKELEIEQLRLQGVVRAIDGSWIAVVENSSKRSIFLQGKEELYNGVDPKIDAHGVVFQENVLDAEGKKTTKEVAKRLSEQ